MGVFLKVLLFIIKLPFKVLALIFATILSVVAIMISLIEGMGTILIGFFNLFLLVAILGIIYSKDWNLFLNVGVLIAFEAVILLLVNFAQGVLIFLKEMLISFVIGS